MTARAFSMLLVCLCCGTGVLLAQPKALNPNKRHLKATRSDSPISVDGRLDEAIWQNAERADAFTQASPNPGQPSAARSEVRLLYDDRAIYIGAFLHEDSLANILRELSPRDDDDGNTDWFGVVIDSYQDGINGFAFGVTAAGVQVDVKFSPLGEDRGWDAVWESAVHLSDAGWGVEMEIPYAALRFPEAEAQIWHINFARSLRRLREESWWNPVDPAVDGLLLQSGQLHGIEGISPPLRLQLYPYISAYAEHYYDGNNTPASLWGRSFNGGMDLKYGLNDAFTLDMTLVPDFGQVQSDNQVLNLTPFEVRFDENRQFFTEGTELFNKGGLFYSRRIGGQPVNAAAAYEGLAEGERVVENPQETPLYNASKLSGRLASGLGIGLFNAISGPTHAVVENAAGQRREVPTAPLSNYNVLVFDQNLPNNSYVTLINTNVLRSGETYDANVTGTEFALRDRKNTYQFFGSGALSQRYFGGGASGQHLLDLGHTYSWELSKISGQWQGGAGYNEESDTYNPNDLGFLQNPNERVWWAWVDYNIFKPFGAFNRMRFNLSSFYSRLYRPDTYNNFGLDFSANATTKKFLTFGIWGYAEPLTTYDYFEPRKEGFFYRFPKNYQAGGFISSDYRKRFALDLELSYRHFEEEGRYRLNYNISPRYRVNNRLNFIWVFEVQDFFNDIGFVNYNAQGNPVLGRRDQVTVINVLRARYIFTDRMSLTFRMRHYWSQVNYDRFHELDAEGRLQPSAYVGEHDVIYDAFTIDAVYTWRFAPGSDLIIVWKNNLFNAQVENTTESYTEHLDTLLSAPQSNSLSLRLVYFLDYATLFR